MDEREIAKFEGLFNLIAEIWVFETLCLFPTINTCSCLDQLQQTDVILQSLTIIISVLTAWYMNWFWIICFWSIFICLYMKKLQWQHLKTLWHIAKQLWYDMTISFIYNKILVSFVATWPQLLRRNYYQNLMLKKPSRSM